MRNIQKLSIRFVILTCVLSLGLILIAVLMMSIALPARAQAEHSVSIWGRAALQATAMPTSKLATTFPREVGFSSESYTANEENSPFPVEVRLREPIKQSAEVKLKTLDQVGPGYAIAGIDYEAFADYIIPLSKENPFEEVPIVLYDDDIKDGCKILKLELDASDKAIYISPKIATIYIVDNEDPSAECFSGGGNGGIKLFLPLISRDP